MGNDTKDVDKVMYMLRKSTMKDMMETKCDQAVYENIKKFNEDKNFKLDQICRSISG